MHSRFRLSSLDLYCYVREYRWWLILTMIYAHYCGLNFIIISSYGIFKPLQGLVSFSNIAFLFCISFVMFITWLNIIIIIIGSLISLLQTIPLLPFSVFCYSTVILAANIKATLDRKQKVRRWFARSSRKHRARNEIRFYLKGLIFLTSIVFSSI